MILHCSIGAAKALHNDIDETDYAEKARDEVCKVDFISVRTGPATTLHVESLRILG